MTKIGFIGLGNVGAKLSGSLLRNGTDLMVRDLNKDAAAPLLAVGALWADSPKQMAEMCDVIITCLPSPTISAAVIEAEDGVLAGFGPGKIWAEMSTTDETEIHRLAALVAKKGGGLSTVLCLVAVTAQQREIYLSLRAVTEMYLMKCCRTLQRWGAVFYIQARLARRRF